MRIFILQVNFEVRLLEITAAMPRINAMRVAGWKINSFQLIQTISIIITYELISLTDVLKLSNMFKLHAYNLELVS